MPTADDELLSEELLDALSEELLSELLLELLTEELLELKELLELLELLNEELLELLNEELLELLELLDDIIFAAQRDFRNSSKRNFLSITNLY